MYSVGYQSQHLYNTYEQSSSFHINHANELPGLPSIDYGPSLSENHTAVEAPAVINKKQESKDKKPVGRLVVDTSSFSIEERLVAAVWVHERKRTKTSMGQIKSDFRQRFGREPPAKNTLLVWERKLFSSGSVHDAPRPGRPVKRSSKVAEVSASLAAAPALSLRARAAALRVPRSTLRAILQRDLRHVAATCKKVPKKSNKPSVPGAPDAPLRALYH